MAHQTKKERKLTDAEIAALAKKGDNNALTEIITRYEKKVYNFALRFMNNREDAEDVLQETFLSVIKAIGSFEGRSSLSTWIYRIASNASLMKLRSKKRVFDTFEEDKIDMTIDYQEVRKKMPDSPLELLQNKDILDRVTESLDELPPKHRSVFLLRDMEGFSTNEVSEMLNMAVPAVKSNLRRARIALRDKLADHLITN
ncbi:RNA polymerase sigma factor [candidate division KSB1 bacterium]